MGMDYANILFGPPGDRCATRLRVTLWVLYVAVYVGCLFVFSFRGAPYESWDEIAVYNSARTVGHPSNLRIFAYGPLDTFQQMVGTRLYSLLNPPGTHPPVLHYANAVPLSFFDNDLAFKDHGWDGVDYQYFRGLSNRAPIFWSRRVHVVVIGTLLALLGFVLIRTFGGPGLLGAMTFGVYLHGPTFLDRAPLSLPAAQNPIVICLCLALLVVALMRHSRSCLFGALVSFVAALNLKGDVLVFIVPVLIGVVLFIARESGSAPRRTLIVQVLLVTVGALAAFRPALILWPREDLGMLFGVARAAQGHASVAANGAKLLSALRADLAGPLIFGRPGPGVPAAVAVAVAVVPLLWVVWRRDHRPLLLIAIGSALGIVTVTCCASAVFPRYFLAGLGAWFLLLGLLAGFWAGDAGTRRARVVARCLAGYLLLQVAWTLGSTVMAAARNAGQLQSAGWLDPSHTRNRAVLYACEKVRSGDYQKTVLVDQHGYIDLDAFQTRDVDARYIDMFGAFAGGRPVFEGSRKVLVLHVPGSINRVEGWDRNWTPEERARYNRFRSAITNFPRVAVFPGGTPFELLWHGPALADTTVEVRAADPAVVDSFCRDLAASAVRPAPVKSE